MDVHFVFVYDDVECHLDLDFDFKLYFDVFDLESDLDLCLHFYLMRAVLLILTFILF